MSEIVVLERARRLLSRGYSAPFLARDANGYSCDPSAPDAVAWDGMGALIASSKGDHEAMDAALDLLERQLLGHNECHMRFCHWQDDPGGPVVRPLREVLALFSRTINRARREVTTVSGQPSAGTTP